LAEQPLLVLALTFLQEVAFMGRFFKVLTAVMVATSVVWGQCGSQILQGVNFRIGSAELLLESHWVLDNIANFILSYPNVSFEIQGHTSAEGVFSERRVENNLRFSQDRANSVMDYLIQQGVPASQLRAVGYGEGYPIADNATQAGREQNRRVVLVGGHSTDVAATCTTPQICTICDKVLVAALGHNLPTAFTVRTAATCIETGLEFRRCMRSDCTHEITREIPIDPTAHDWDEGMVIQELTCLTNGIREYTCLNDATHTKQEITTALGHLLDWQETTAATCEATGEETGTCTRGNCEHSENREIVALDHDWSDWEMILPAICGRAGEEERICTRRGCDHSESNIIPALIHNWGTWSTWGDTTATCTEAGDRTRTRSCSLCYEVGREILPVPALGHLWNSWSIWNVAVEASCTADGSRERTRTCNACTETDSETREIPQLTELDGCAPSLIRNKQNADSRYGIFLENAIVSDMARISVITPEPATVNLTIFDNLGNVVFASTGSATSFALGLSVGEPVEPTIIWNLTNAAGRYVANGTYLIVVEATGISGRRFSYSARIGVNR